MRLADPVQSISLKDISYPNMVTSGGIKREESDLNRSLLLRASGFNHAAVHNHGFEMLRLRLQDRV